MLLSLKSIVCFDCDNELQIWWGKKYFLSIECVNTWGRSILAAELLEFREAMSV